MSTESSRILYRVNPIVRFEVIETVTPRTLIQEESAERNYGTTSRFDEGVPQTRGIGEFPSFAHALEVAKAMGSIAGYTNPDVTVDGGHKPEVVVFAYTPEHARILQDMASALAASLPSA